jgi:hypothetical protein
MNHDLTTHAVIPRSGRITGRSPDDAHAFPPMGCRPHASIPLFAIFTTIFFSLLTVRHDTGFVNFFVSAYVLFPVLGDWLLAPPPEIGRK